MDPLDHIPVQLRSGQEPFISNGNNIGFKLLDFWQWSVSDILSNATRGRLAEFIVATAIKVNTKTVRTEWDAYDLLTPDGIKVEIKSAAYLQSWKQKTLSKISFSTRLTRSWDEATEKRSEQALRQADVYIFCLLSHQDKQTVDPLNLDQWEFYVLPTRRLNDYTRSKHSISLSSLKKLVPAIVHDQLDTQIKFCKG